MFDFLKRSLAGRFLDRIDGAGRARWPVAWVRVRRAAIGWKLIVGAIVFY